MAFHWFKWFVHAESASAFVARVPMFAEDEPVPPEVDRLYLECMEVGPAYTGTREEALALGINGDPNACGYEIHVGFPSAQSTKTQLNMCAKLTAPTGGSGLQIDVLAPVGQHCAICLRVNDLFGVERPDFNNPQLKEIKDVTRFIFGLYGQDGKPYLVQTYEFTISGAPGSNLSKFLQQWLGTPALMGWDYCEMLGKPALLTVAHKPSKSNPGQIYANITGIAPLPQQMAAYCPPAQNFAAMLQKLEADAAARNPTPPAGAPPAVPGGGYRPPQPPPPAPAAPAFTPPPAPPAAFVPPPPAAPAFTPPPPPAPPPPVAGPTHIVHLNGQNHEVTLAQLNTCPVTAPAMAKGDQAWRYVRDFLPAPGATPPPAFTPPPAPPATAALDEEVPF